MALSLEGLGFCAKVFACNPKGRGAAKGLLVGSMRSNLSLKLAGKAAL